MTEVFSLQDMTFSEINPIKETIRILNNSIATYGCPAIMWTDDGDENNGEKMLDFLKEHQIYPHFTFPRNLICIYLSLNHW